MEKHERLPEEDWLCPIRRALGPIRLIIIVYNQPCGSFAIYQPGSNHYIKYSSLMYFGELVYVSQSFDDDATTSLPERTWNLLSRRRLAQVHVARHAAYPRYCTVVQDILASDQCV